MTCVLVQRIIDIIRSVLSVSQHNYVYVFNKNVPDPFALNRHYIARMYSQIDDSQHLSNTMLVISISESLSSYNEIYFKTNYLDTCVINVHDMNSQTND